MDELDDRRALEGRVSSPLGRCFGGFTSSMTQCPGEHVQVNGRPEPRLLAGGGGEGDSSLPGKINLRFSVL